MPILNTAAKLAVKPFPRAISPKTHAMIDYTGVGLFFVAATLFWKRNKRASLAALITGGAELALDLLTDYPGGMNKAISFKVHREIDLGLAAMAAAMPEFLGFADQREKKFFLAQGAAITAVAELSRPSRERTHSRQKDAA